MGRDIQEFDSRRSAVRRFGLFNYYANQFVEKCGSHREFIAMVKGQFHVMRVKRGIRYRRFQKPG